MHGHWACTAGRKCRPWTLNGAALLLLLFTFCYSFHISSCYLFWLYTSYLLLLAENCYLVLIINVFFYCLYFVTACYSKQPVTTVTNCYSLLISLATTCYILFYLLLIVTTFILLVFTSITGFGGCYKMPEHTH